MRYLTSVCSVIFFTGNIASQYLTLNNKTPRSVTCEHSSKTALVEHFFNIIFTEFHNTPPVCVCVQMCVDQSTYCYPNGCLKREDRKKSNDNLQPVSIQSGNTRPSIFLVDEQNDFMADLLSRAYGDDKIVANTEKAYIKELRPDPFKDKYKAVFKYKKMPKVELRYNLREQVKNMKSDVLKIETIDVSKTRWPTKKHNKLNSHATFALTSERKPSKTDNNKFFFSTNPDNEVLNYPPRFSKRDLTNVNGDEVDKIKAVYIADKSADSVQNTSFSLETLIDNLIESSFEANNTEFEINIDLISSKSDEINKTIQTETVKDNLARTETTKVLSMNLTTENLKKNKYNGETESYTNIFNEMITSLSRKIDKQNNTSMEIIGKITGDCEIRHDEQVTEATEADEFITPKTTYVTEKQNYINMEPFGTNTGEYEIKHADQVTAITEKEVFISLEKTNKSEKFSKSTYNVTNVSYTTAETFTENVLNSTLMIKTNEFPVNHVTIAPTDHNEVRTTTKSRQRISRKSQNRKSN